MNSIKIFRGDDTNYNGEKFLRIKINANYSLVGFKGIFRLGCFESVSENLIVSEENEKYGEMEVSIPREKSSLFQFGEMKGVFRLVDTENRYKTVATDIPFFVTNKVFVQEEDEFELSVPEGSEVSIIVNAYASTGGTSDYNKLQNKPTFEGKTIEGELTYQSLGVAPLQSLNSLGEEVNVIKTDLGDLGDQVHEIEAKIPENTSDKNQLVNSSQLSEKVDASGDTMTGTLNVPELNVATSEGTLNLSITAGVATIATNNGLDIVSQTKFDKAPTTDDSTTWADALDTSLVRKAQVATAIAEAGGGGSVPENVYTKENLLGGKGVEIVPEPVEGGIDENTLSCFHLDENTEDIVTGYIPPNVTIDNTLHKFGTGSTMWVNTTSFPWSLNSYESFSFDFWIYRKSDRSAALGLGTVGGSPSCHIRLFSGNYPISFSIHGLSKTTEAYVDNNTWSHIYVYYNVDDRSYHLFLNGKEVYSEVNTTDFSNLNSFNSDGYTTSRFDEIRISKCIRWTEDFEPPTKPYSVAVPTGNYVINGATKTSQLKNDTSFVSGDGIGKIKRITQAEYDALATKDENILYVLVGE